MFATNLPFPFSVSPAAVDSPMFHIAWGKVPNGDKYKEFYTKHAQVCFSSITKTSLFKYIGNFTSKI